MLRFQYGVCQHEAAIDPKTRKRFLDDFRFHS